MKELLQAHDNIGNLMSLLCKTRYTNANFLISGECCGVFGMQAIHNVSNTILNFIARGGTEERAGSSSPSASGDTL